MLILFEYATVFIDTLDITYAVLDTALQRHRPLTDITENDQSDKHLNLGNKNPTIIISDVKNLINSFPRIESHYCRKSTSKKYLETNLNLSKKYDLYVMQCDNLNVVPVKESMYGTSLTPSSTLHFTSLLRTSATLHRVQ